MSLQSWAEQLLRATAFPDVIDLHVNDTIAAFLTGLRAKDGQAIVSRYAGGIDLSERAAAVSAIARLSECDDIHLASCVTPGAIVIPVALALFDGCGAGDFGRAVSAGYATGIHLGAAIGGARALARGVWPTLFAAPVMAAVSTSVLKDGDRERLAHAVALALADARGRVDNPGQRWILLADATLRGIRAAEAAQAGERGDLTSVSEGIDLDLQASAASIETVGFKPFPIARQGANAVVAFQRLLANGLDPRDIDAIEASVPSANVALLSRPASETDRLSRLCNMGLQLAAAALAPDLLYDPERTPRADVLEFARRVTVTTANDLEGFWPYRWAARVVVHTSDRRLEETVIQAPLDFDASDLAQVVRDKWRRMLSERDLALLNHGQSDDRRYATLWQQIERRLRTPMED